MSDQMIQDQLRSLVLECLSREFPRQRNQNPFKPDWLFDLVAEHARKRGLKYRESIDAWHLHEQTKLPKLHGNLKEPVTDIVWDLIIEGVLRPNGHNEQEFFRVHLTDYGRQVLENENSPHDPDGYIRSLEETVPNIDPIITTYLAESAETLRRNCLLSSTVTLGCASEKAFLILMDTYEAGLNSADQTQFKAKRNKCYGKIKREHKLFMDWFERKIKPLKPIANTDQMGELENALKFLLDYFRIARNDAGHPSGKRRSKVEVHSNFIVFPTYLRRVYDLIEWIDNNKPL